MGGWVGHEEKLEFPPTYVPKRGQQVVRWTSGGHADVLDRTAEENVRVWQCAPSPPSFTLLTM